MTDNPAPGDQVQVTFAAQVVETRGDALLIVVGKTDNFDGYLVWVPMGAEVTAMKKGGSEEPPRLRQPR